MTPFQNARLWLRRGPVSERVAVAVAATVAVALLAWLLVPSDGDSSTAEIATGSAAPGEEAGPGAAPAPGAPGTSPTVTAPAPGAESVPGSSTALGAAGTAETAAEGCESPPGSAPGISATEIKVAVTLTEIYGPAANTTFGGEPAEVREEQYRIVIDALNAAGGIACRKLVPTFYRGNPADQTDLHALCLEIAKSGAYAVLDQGAYADYPPVMCFAQNKIPYFGSYILAKHQFEQGYPYLFNFRQYDNLYHDAVFALRDRGFFSAENGFKKLGFVYRSCNASLISAFKGWLKQAGVPESATETYDVGCPSAFANPGDISQAVLKFQRTGVTHVTTASFVGDFPNFTAIAQQQGFRPKYGIGDDAVIQTTGGRLHPNYDNIDGAIAIVQSRAGEATTPGATPTPATQKCDAIFNARGHKSTYELGIGGGGRICNNVAYFAAAVNNAPSLSRDALAAGLQRAGSVDMSYPEGPTDYRRNRVTWGGEFWRPAQFFKDCTCWRVLDLNFRPNFPE